MKRAIAAALAFGALAAPAMAADLYVKAPAPIPVCEWCGLYLGVNAGYSLGVDRYSTTVSGFPASAVFPNNPYLSGGDTNALTGGMFGGQIGYNWQAGNIVFGGEFDWDWSGERNSSYKSVQNISGALFNTGLTDSEKINSLGTLRARIGWANHGWLWYVTGGGAWAQYNDTYSAATSLPAFTFPATSVSYNSTRFGGTVGAGVETHLWGGWSAKLEYLYANLGSVNNSFTTSPTAAGNFGTVTSSHSLEDHIVRIGVNYRIW